jgi:phosphohistidine phosphatase
MLSSLANMHEVRAMDLILWRHAEAEDGVPDMTRPLTAKGKKQAQQLAGWLSARLPKQTRILVSPALRTLQTAEALTDEFEVMHELAPGAAPAALLAACEWPHRKGAVLIVGHQPTLGLLASTLIAGQAMPWSIKKGAAWWISHQARDPSERALLRAAIAPDFA